jgi:hypothetical protein
MIYQQNASEKEGRGMKKYKESYQLLNCTKVCQTSVGLSPQALAMWRYRQPPRADVALYRKNILLSVRDPMLAILSKMMLLWIRKLLWVML